MERRVDGGRGVPVEEMWSAARVCKESDERAVTELTSASFDQMNARRTIGKPLLRRQVILRYREHGRIQPIAAHLL